MYMPLICPSRWTPAKEAPQLRRLLLEVLLGRLLEMSAKDLLQQLAVHVLIEDVAVTQSAPAETAPHIELHWMGQLLHRILWIVSLTRLPTHPYLTHETLALELLLIGEHNLHPILCRHVRVALCEREARTLLLIRQSLLVTSDTTEQIDLSHATIDRTRRSFESILPLEATRGAEVLLDVASSDYCSIHRFVGAARAAAARLVLHFSRLLVVRDPVPDGRLRASQLNPMSSDDESDED